MLRAPLLVTRHFRRRAVRARFAPSAGRPCSRGPGELSAANAHATFPTVLEIPSSTASSTPLWQSRNSFRRQSRVELAFFARIRPCALPKRGRTGIFYPFSKKRGAHEQKRAAYRSQGVEKRTNSAKKAAELLTLARSSPPVISKARQPNWERGATCEAALEPLCNEPFPCGSSGQENASRCRQNGRKASPR